MTYVEQMSTLNFGPSIANYPRTVSEIMSDALPWTIICSARRQRSRSSGQFSGRGPGLAALAAFLQYLLPPLLTLSAIPYYLLGLVLLYILAFPAAHFSVLRRVHPGHAARR